MEFIPFPKDGPQTIIFKETLRIFEPFPGQDPEKGIFSKSKITLQRSYTLYGNQYGDFTKDTLNKFSEIEKNFKSSLGFDFNARKAIASCHPLRSEKINTLSIEDLMNYFMGNVVSGGGWNEEIDRKLRNKLEEAGKKIFAASEENVLTKDLSDKQIVSVEDIKLLDGAMAEFGTKNIATHILLEPKTVNVKCYVNEFISQVNKQYLQWESQK